MDCALAVLVLANDFKFISKIKKENFDLKLELFHRRQRAEVLEAKFAHVEHLEKNNEELSRDNEEMQSINEDLLTELEKRDAAIQEAVGLICELEGKLEKVVSADRSSVRSGSTRGKPTPDQSPSQAVDRSLPAPHMPQTSSPSASRPKPKSQYKDVTPERLPESMPLQASRAPRPVLYLQNSREHHCSYKKKIRVPRLCATSIVSMVRPSRVHLVLHPYTELIVIVLGMDNESGLMWTIIHSLRLASAN